MRKSLQKKVIITFVAAILGCMAVMILATKIFLRPLFINDSKNSMKRYAEEVNAALRNGGEGIGKMLSTIDTAYLIKTTVLSDHFQVLYGENDTTENGISRMERWIKEDEARNDREEVWFKERYDEDYQLKRLYYFRRTADGGYIVMNKAIKGIEQDVQIVSFFITIMSLAVTVIGIVIWSFLTRPFTDQLIKMSRIAQNMSRLDFGEKINYSSQDEIGILAESIDQLSERLEISIGDLQSDVERRKMLMRSLSHELKTPITTIRGYVENTQIVAAENKKVQRYCNIMIEECDTIDSIVNEILEMSRLESSEYVCEMTCQDMKSLLDNEVQKLRIEFPGADIRLAADGKKMYCSQPLMERAVHNYVKNAVRYGRSGSPVCVEGHAEKERYEIFVINEGEEIPEAERNLIWDVFYKKDKARTRDKSHGIGLSIVRQIAVLHNGDVDVQCAKGQTKFSIWIPCIGTGDGENDE